ncbi:MAG: M23 family metallopeptidase [Verrucomicrobia bacterium]|nr:M23 family metallopeptidase [Verrucomicrobiota bacterium]MCG2680188.1 M23 family metallopeptidase [Kiritimatiellia bacterium]MBU4247506.1 M23 family metallopeptidase [Verrucomicrobiota bacterium]MBU4289475.1 M23 family metallopeptidase [Verrucomicrobiota bacterium]MBU4429640.1 M23 family metallopeptidase [Verrucomicrobiota bacterium]
MYLNWIMTMGLRAGVLATALVCAGGCARQETPALEPPAASALTNSVEPDSLRKMAYPTDRKSLAAREDSGDFRPTASGRIESALYGSVRTERNGKGLAPSFHEGIDIAPLNTDAHGRPQDAIAAVADGTVAYANRVVGNSNYGKYVVLRHASSLGELYTLYAHLAQIAPGVKAGQAVKAGAILGIMGNTSSSPIPMARAHLHFELGFMVNAHYDRWYHAQKLKPDHGIFNGGNLLGLDPLAVFERQKEDPAFTFAEYLKTILPAFEIVLFVPRRPDYFRRYPALWDGPAFSGRAMVLAVSENGLPLRGWNAAEPDRQEQGKKKWRIRNMNAAALGRNGCRLIVCRRRTWTLSAAGEKWLEILTYP